MPTAAMPSSSSGSSEAQPSPAPSTVASSAPSALSTDVTTNPATMPQAPEKVQDDTSKLKMFLSILRRFIGVTDLASARFSLPAQLLEPTPNLEYWNYLDRPETFTSIGDSDDELERMLAVLRFWFTKDLKYVKGKPCKPYNSALGEFFRCNWVIEDEPPTVLKGVKSTQTTTTTETSKKPVTVSYLTEQTCHHPPISAFFVDCPQKSITACGFDQLSVKFTGTSLRVMAGGHNLGIFITLHNRDEELYQLTHPTAHLGGLLRGSLNVTVADTCYLRCPKTKIKVILHYLEEGWLGRTQNKVHGVVFRYDPDKDTKSKIKEVSEKDVLARIEGNWQDKLHFTLPSAPGEKHLLVDLNPLFPAQKIVPPPENQLPNESRRFWSEVTAAIHARQFSKATVVKQQLEERQREKTATRAAKGEGWTPRFFIVQGKTGGRPDLTEEGREALRRMQRGDFVLEEGENGGI